MQMFSRPFRELIPRNKDGDYCSLNPKTARLILEEKLKMVMRLRNREGGSMPLLHATQLMNICRNGVVVPGVFGAGQVPFGGSQR